MTEYLSEIGIGTESEYQLIERLGAGLTGVVWRAQESESGDKVAVKVLTAGASETIQELFWQEAEMLAQLNHAEQELNDGMRIAPQLRQMQRVQKPYFFAMDLAKGDSLERFVDEQWYLDELQILAVMEQMLRMVDVLHTHLGRARGNFALRDFFLDAGNVQHPALSIVDWGGTAAATPETIQNDLAQVGALFYRLVTHKAADARGEVEMLLAQRGGTGWNQATTGTRSIITRALHPNPARRFATAADFRRAIQEQIGTWQLDWADLLAQAQNELRADELTPENALQISNALEIAERRGGDIEKIEFYRRALYVKTQRVSPAFISGQREYRDGEYALAAAIWQQETARVGRIDLWRWALVAQIGAETHERFETVRLELECVLDHLKVYEAAPALKILDELAEQISSPSLEVLAMEATARQHLAHARALSRQSSPEAWQRAIESYTFADDCLNVIPYGNLLRDQEGWGDLRARAAALEAWRQIRANVETTHAEIALQLQNDWHSGLVALEQALQSDPTSETLLQMCLDIGERWRAQNELRSAIRAFEIGLVWGQSPELEYALHTARIETQRAMVENDSQTFGLMFVPDAEVLDAILNRERIQIVQAEADKYQLTANRLVFLALLQHRVMAEWAARAQQEQNARQEVETQQRITAERLAEMERVLTERENERVESQQRLTASALAIAALEVERREQLTERDAQIERLTRERDELNQTALRTKKELAQLKRESEIPNLVLPPRFTQAVTMLLELAPDSIRLAEQALKSYARELEAGDGDWRILHLVKQALMFAHQLTHPLQQQAETILKRYALQDARAMDVTRSRGGLDYFKKYPVIVWLQDERTRLTEANRAFERGNLPDALQNVEHILQTFHLTDLIVRELWREAFGDSVPLRNLLRLEKLKHEKTSIEKLRDKYRAQTVNQIK